MQLHGLSVHSAASSSSHGHFSEPVHEQMLSSALQVPPWCHHWPAVNPVGWAGVSECYTCGHRTPDVSTAQEPDQLTPCNICRKGLNSAAVLEKVQTCPLRGCSTTRQSLCPLLQQCWELIKSPCSSLQVTTF